MRSSLFNANKDCGCDGNEGFRFSKHDFKGLHLPADLFQRLQCGEFAAPQLTRRQQGEMGRQMGQVGVQFLTESGDKFSDGITHVSHKRITGTVHGE